MNALTWSAPDPAGTTYMRGAAAHGTRYAIERSDVRGDDPVFYVYRAINVPTSAQSWGPLAPRCLGTARTIEAAQALAAGDYA